MQDITEQTKLHDQLKEKTKSIRNQYELARQAELIRNVSTWQLNTQNNTLFWSENLFRIFGYAPYSFEPDIEKFISMVHPDDKQIVLQAMENMNKIETGNLPLIEYRVFDKEGKIKYLRSGGRVVKNNTGKYISGTVYDITEYGLIRKQLLGNQQLLQTIIDTDRDAISIYDNNLRCIVWNKRSAELYGKTKSEAIGEFLFNIIPKLDKKTMMQR